MTKKAKLKAIVAANKRLQRMRKAGLTESQGYKASQESVAKSRGESPFEMKHKTISTSKKQTKEQLEKSYRAAKSILKEEETRVGYIKRKVREAERELKYSISEQKRQQTFSERFNMLPTDKVYDILKGKQFQQLKEVFGDSDQIVSAMREAINNGISTTAIKRRMTALMKFWQHKSVMTRYSDVMEDLLSADDGKFENKIKDVLK